MGQGLGLDLRSAARAAWNHFITHQDAEPPGGQGIELLPNGDLRMSADVLACDLQDDPFLATHYPMVIDAIESSGLEHSPVTLASEILQSSLCPYYFNLLRRCNRRRSGEGCSALEQKDSVHAIVGLDPGACCVAVHGSEVVVALVALDARIELASQRGLRTVTLSDFYRAPLTNATVEHRLWPDERVRSIVLPELHYPMRTAFLRETVLGDEFAGALSAGVALAVERGVIRKASLTLGGVGYKPWRDTVAEDFLREVALDRVDIRGAVALLLREARGGGQIDYKVEAARDLMTRTLVSALGVV